MLKNYHRIWVRKSKIKEIRILAIPGLIFQDQRQITQRKMRWVLE